MFSTILSRHENVEEEGSLSLLTSPGYCIKDGGGVGGGWAFTFDLFKEAQLRFIIIINRLLPLHSFHSNT